MPAFVLIAGIFALVSLAIVSKASAQDVPEVTTVKITPPDVPITKTITNDPATWPSGDALWDVCRAIATAEGYYNAQSNPYKLNNPGDISDGAQLYSQEFHSGSSITHFPDAATGWTWLYNKLRNIRDGKSSSYNAAWTWTRFAQTYAANWQNWVNNVTDYLGVDADSTFADYVNG